MFGYTSKITIVRCFIFILQLDNTSPINKKADPTSLPIFYCTDLSNNIGKYNNYVSKTSN